MKKPNEMNSQYSPIADINKIEFEFFVWKWISSSSSSSVTCSIRHKYLFESLFHSMCYHGTAFAIYAALSSFYRKLMKTITFFVYMNSILIKLYSNNSNRFQRLLIWFVKIQNRNHKIFNGMVTGLLTSIKIITILIKTKCVWTSICKSLNLIIVQSDKLN